MYLTYCYLTVSNIVSKPKPKAKLDGSLAHNFDCDVNKPSCVLATNVDLFACFAERLFLFKK